MLSHGHAISMNQSLAVHYFKLSADRGDEMSQVNYGLMFYHGNDISMKKSHVVY
jgi:TPR repeat protein